MVIVISPPKFGKTARVIVAAILLALGLILTFLVTGVAVSITATEFESDALTIIAFSPVGYVLVFSGFAVGLLLGGMSLIRSILG
ncbi:hypothetical protein Ngar_c13770 [Candidatus Nitrososphaera gargensis Ga9.2]|uniref:Uncharacterized protein n=1 Tax=Nitrososphaera gargensis (strain Ga9.2) TaxID=1237085 RepID=K0IMW1_NITGG|nr:hypothetical protein [Candidatus Nitrososphaera gargensis]AFU58314.1 hypothetical protein Ngar_c13770 [Candidatus Nitrososphaera gargensis Ga9.2]